MFTCDVGDIVYIQNAFYDSAGTAVDPTTITLYLKQPSSVGTYTYASGSVSKVAVGTYAFNGTATEAGYWRARWVGDGAAIAAEQGIYFVRSKNV